MSPASLPLKVCPSFSTAEKLWTLLLVLHFSQWLRFTLVETFHSFPLIFVLTSGQHFWLNLLQTGPPFTSFTACYICNIVLWFFISNHHWRLAINFFIYCSSILSRFTNWFWSFLVQCNLSSLRLTFHRLFLLFAVVTTCSSNCLLIFCRSQQTTIALAFHFAFLSLCEFC